MVVEYYTDQGTWEQDTDPRDIASHATILKMDGDPEGPVEHNTRRRNPCGDCASITLDHHYDDCSIYRVPA